MRKFFFIIITAFLFWPGLTNAQVKEAPTITVSPGTFEIDVLGGEILQKEILLRNETNTPLPIKIKTISFDAADETGGMTFFDDSSDGELSAQTWLQPEKKEFILDAKQTVFLPVKIIVPVEALPGGQYVVMLFEPQLPSFYFETNATKVLPVVGVLFLFNVQKDSLSGQIGEYLSILEIKWQGRQASFLQGLSRFLETTLAWVLPQKVIAASDHLVYVDPPEEFKMRLKNNQLWHIKPSGFVRVHNIFNRVVTETEVRQFTILPGRVREVPVSLGWTNQDSFWPHVFGRYVVEVSLTTKEGYVFNQWQVLWILPWQYMLSTFIIVGLFLFFVLQFNSRIKKFVMVLFTGKYRI
ncbi:MAG: hypothetical protein KatS3mg027_2536 [Bacteroidia bacterium]|nr:MAG: hypothetical protein KatS3mg027_2536 [Bacteroidia bacterium]